MTLPGGAAGGTNWDRGINQVAQSASAFDVLVVITDGNPTFYGDPVQGPGSRTRFREVENGIFSANAVKAEGTKVLAVGVGAGVTSPASGLNLRSISGPTLNTDYYQTTDYAAAGAALRALALGSCEGSITVVKQVVPSTTDLPADRSSVPRVMLGAQPQGGWDFTGVRHHPNRLLPHLPAAPRPRATALARHVVKQVVPQPRHSTAGAGGGGPSPEPARGITVDHLQPTAPDRARTSR